MWQCTVMGATSAPLMNHVNPHGAVVPRGVRRRAAPAQLLGWRAARVASAAAVRRARVAITRVHVTCGAIEPGSAQIAFHQRRMQGSSNSAGGSRLKVHVRPATADELPVVAMLRARAFYVYPPERAWAGQRMQQMEAEKELLRLQSVAAGALEGGERVTTLVGVVPAAEVSLNLAASLPLDSAGSRWDTVGAARSSLMWRVWVWGSARCEVCRAVSSHGSSPLVR
jgi:hypothetical protein